MKIPSQSLFTAFLGLLVGTLVLPTTSADLFEVDHFDDRPDVLPGDGLCQTDTGFCSLRAAIQEANALSGADEVHLPSGTFPLNRLGTNEDAADTGDLDISDSLILEGAGEAKTIIDGQQGDRIFEVHPQSGSLTFEIRNLTLQNGRAEGPNPDSENGGCLRMPESGQLILQGVTIQGCRCRRLGCGLFNGGVTTASEVSLIDNRDLEEDSGFARGGGLANVGPSATVNFSDCEFRSNLAENGGAVYTATSPNPSVVEFNRCTFVANRVRQLGGAIHLDFSSEVRLFNSTLTLNEAGNGGGLFNDGGGLYLIRNTTIVGNHASNIGGGISEVHFHPDQIQVTNSIIAGNTADFRGPDCDFRLRSDGATLIGDTTNCEVTIAVGDLLDVDPNLGPARSLGRGLGFWPHSDSPVIDAGHESLCISEDQGQQLRPLDGDGDGEARCDLGSIESPELLMKSGFETGDFTEWSAVTP